MRAASGAFGGAANLVHALPWAESSKGSFASFSAGVVEGVQTIAVIWRNLPDVWEIVRLSAIQMAQNVVAAIATIPENAAIVGNYLANNWVKLISDGANAVMAIFRNLGERAAPV